MSYISKLFFYIGKFFYSSDDYILYEQRTRKETGQTSEEIKEYSDYSQIPDFIVKKLSLFPFVNPLYHRLKSNKASLVCINNGNNLIAYGWLQTWDAFRRKFGWIIKEGTMLGPFWTNPDFRGKGYYGHLLNYCKNVSDIHYPLIIYTNPSNLSSQKGIEKAGFVKIGIFRVYLILRYFQWHRNME